MNAPAIESHPGWVRRLDGSSLQRGLRHYNPTICRIGERTLCAYRVQDVRGRSRLGILELNSKTLAPKYGTDRALEIPAPESAHLEDPRLIELSGMLILLFSQVDYKVSDWRTGFIMRMFFLNPKTFAPEAEMALPFGKNGQGVCEKNWMPFALPDGGLGLVHSLSPHRVIHVNSREHFETPGIARWRYGTVSGRTPAISLGDSYLALIGGHLPHPRRKSLYWVGAYRFAKTAPHAIVGVSRVPLFWASEESSALLNPYDPDWNPVCAFPAGLIRENESTLLISLGVNDSFCDLLRLELKEVLSGMVSLDELTDSEKIVASELPPIGGQVRVRVVSRQPLNEAGGPYIKGDEFFTSESHASALGRDQVEVLA